MADGQDINSSAVQVSGQTADFINYQNVASSIPAIVLILLFGAASDAVGSPLADHNVRSVKLRSTDSKRLIDADKAPL
jgi:hypothetical protein